MAWCRQATSHYLSQCWLSLLSPYGVARPQWVKMLHAIWFCIGPMWLRLGSCLFVINQGMKSQNKHATLNTNHWAFLIWGDLTIRCLIRYWCSPLGSVSIKTVFPALGIPIIKMRWFSDCLIFIMGISIPARLHLYIEMALWWLCRHNVQNLKKLMLYRFTFPISFAF